MATKASPEAAAKFMGALEKILADAVEEGAPTEPDPMDVSGESLEALFAEMRANEDAANAQVRPEQAALTWGDHFLRLYPMGEQVLAIFGRIPSAEEFERSEGSDGLARHTEIMERGYRFAWCHSIIEPEGEPGDTHVVTVWPITEAQFAEAKAVGWDPERLPWIADVGPDRGTS